MSEIKKFGEFLKEEMEKSQIPSLDEKVETYYKTYSAAVQAALKMVEDRGYTYDGDDWMQISAAYSKPSIGKTTTWRMPISNKKQLSVSVYAMDSGNYELTAYIS